MGTCRNVSGHSQPTDARTHPRPKRRAVNFGLLAVVVLGAALLVVVYQYRKAYMAGLRQDFKLEQNQGREAERTQQLMWSSQQAERNEEHARIKNGTSPKGNAGGGFEYTIVSLTDLPEGQGCLTAEIENLRSLDYQIVFFTASATDKAGEPLFRSDIRLRGFRARETRELKYTFSGNSSRFGDLKIWFEQSVESP